MSSALLVFARDPVCDELRGELRPSGLSHDGVEVDLCRAMHEP